MADARSRPADRKHAGFRSTEHEGDRGPVETSFTYDEWCRVTGYNPETGAYDQPPEDVKPCIVVQQHNPHRKDTRAARIAREASGEGVGGGGADTPIGRYDGPIGDDDIYDWYGESFG